MTSVNVGFLHPGAMGVSLAAAARNSGHTAYWVSAGRSPETLARASEHGLRDAGTLAGLCRVCTVVVSICPPHAAEATARDVVSCGFGGLYVDANAIAPERARRVGQSVSDAGAAFVDGAVIGGPAWEPGRTWLYLSGERASEVADLFHAGPLETAVIGSEAGQASALKMCYAAYTKGTTALLCALLAAAERLGVRRELEVEWSRGGWDLAEQAHRRARGVTAKAWRFAGEMDEIAATLVAAGLPDGFHVAAADVYRRIAHFKGASEPPELEEVLDALIGNGPQR